MSEKGKEPDKSKYLMCLPRVPGRDPSKPQPSLTACVALCTDDNRTTATKMDMLPSYSTVTLIDDPPEIDPWDLPALQDTGPKWSGESEAQSYVTFPGDGALCPPLLVKASGSRLCMGAPDQVEAQSTGNNGHLWFLLFPSLLLAAPQSPQSCLPQLLSATQT